MRVTARWAAAITVSLALFAALYALCRYPARLDDGPSWAIAGAGLAVALTIGGWWAARAPGPPAVVTTGSSAAGRASQAVTGSANLVIGGRADMRGVTINVRSGEPGPQSLTPSAPGP